MSPAPVPSTATPAELAASGTQGADAAKGKLEGGDVLELTKFIEKKVWIDAKIKFLAALPPVDATAPLPPAPCPVRKAELKAWWEEHDRIEQEIEDYMGDLARLKAFAEKASKTNLSKSDTDLIEITLTTLLAVDRLMHLLRNRRKSLNLARYRLKWDEQVATAWTEHRRILTDLPRFLSKARWTAPTALDVPPCSETPTSSHSRTSLLLPSTSSSMSRTMRSELLSLELASHKSRINTLVRSALPATSTSLDKLIDTSYAPLPDAFLDEQERLEEATKALTEGLPAFLTGMATQWRHGDEVFWGARGVETGSETLVREVEEALLKLPESVMAEGFEKRAEGLRKELDETREAMGTRRRKGFLPMPEHGAAEEQRARNAELVKGLEVNVARAGRGLGEAVEAAERYRFAALALDRSREVRREMEETATKFRSFVAAVEQLSGRPNLDDPACLHSTNEETTFDDHFAKLAFQVRPQVDGTPPLLHRASVIVVDLTKAGIDPNVRQAVKETMAGLSKLKLRVEELLAEEMEESLRLKAARGLAMGLYECGEGVGAARKTIEKEMDGSRWVEGQIRGDRLDVDALLETLRQQIDTALVAPLAVAKELLLPSHPDLDAHLLSRASALRTTYDDLLRLRTFLDRTMEQQEATSSVLRDFDEVDAALHATASRVEAAVAKPRDAWTDGAISAEHSTLSETTSALERLFNETVGAVHSRIPFLAQTSTPPPPPSALPLSLSPLPTTVSFPSSLPFDLVKQDAAVRACVNAKSAAVGGALEEVRTKLALLEHLLEAFEWDERAERAGKQVQEEEERMRELQQRFVERSSDAEDMLALLLPLVTSAPAALSTSGDSLTALGTSLDALKASPSATSPPFNLHLSRQSTLDEMVKTHRLALEASSTLSASIKSANDSRRAKEEGERICAAEQAAKLAAWQARVAELLEALERTREAAEAIEGAADDQILSLDTWCATARRERSEMLESDDLSIETAPEDSSLRLVQSTRVTLRERLNALLAEAVQVESTSVALRTELPFLESATADFSPAIELAAAVEAALLCSTSRLDVLESHLRVAEEEAKAFEADRAEVLEVRRRMEEEERLAAEAERVRLEEERLAAEAELARVEEERRVVEEAAAKLRAWRARVGELLLALGQTHEATTALSGETESLAQAVDTWSGEARQERLEMLESDSLSQDTRPDDAPLHLAQSTLPSLHQRLDTLRNGAASHGTALAALESDSPSRDTSDADLSPAFELATVVEDALAAASSRLSALYDTVQAAADKAALFERDRSELLESRRVAAEEERLRAETERACLDEERLRAEEAAARLLAWRGRLKLLLDELERTREAATAVDGDADEASTNLSTRCTTSREERIALLEDEALSEESTTDDEPLRLVRSTLPILQQRLDQLRTDAAALEATSSTLADEGATLDGDETDPSSALASTSVLAAIISSISTRLAALDEQLRLTDAERAAWEIERTSHLERRWRDAEEDRLRVEAQARLEEARLEEEDRIRRTTEEGTWAAKQEEQRAGLSSVVDSLQAYESFLETCEDVLANLTLPTSLLRPYPSPPPSQLDILTPPSDELTSVLDRARASQSRLLSDTTLSIASADLDTIDDSRISLREDITRAGGALSDALSKWTTPAPESLRAQIVRLRETSSSLAGALTKAMAREESRLAAGVRRQEEQAAEERSVRHPSNGWPTFTSATDVEDVFGPTPSTIALPTGDDDDNVEISQVAELQNQLATIDVDSWADEKPFLQLPSAADADHVWRQLSLVHALFDDLISDAAGAGLALDADLAPLRAKLQRKTQASERISSFAQFKEKVEVADAALSDLLTSIDAATPSAPHPLDSRRSSSPGAFDVQALPLADALLRASSAVTVVRKEAIPLLGDSRVEAQIGRVEEAYGEMMAMVEDLNPRSSSSSSSVWSSGSRIPSRLFSSRPSSSRQSSRPSTSQQTLFRSSSTTPLPSRPSSATPSSTRISSRSSLSRLPSDPQAVPRKTSKNRSVPTLATPRPRLPSSATLPQSFVFGSTAKGAFPRSVSGGGEFLEPGTPRRESLEVPKRSRKESLTPSMRSVRRDSMASSTSSIRRSMGPSPPVPSLGGGRRSNPGSAERRTSGVSRQGRPIKTHYKANPKRKVDVEVGRIVNQFPVSVPIKAAENDFQDDSGMYWIGETDPRLYFCRILRSKTAMVRIGGGWQELSAFLLTHFGNISPLDISTSPTLSRSTSTVEPSWLSVNSPLSASTSNHWISAGSIQSALFPSTSDHSLTPLSLTHTISGILPSGASSLRKASDAPPRTPKTASKQARWRP